MSGPRFDDDLDYWVDNPDERECPGSGRSWGSGTSTPICRECHHGPGSLGVKRPIRRKGRWTGTVPTHYIP